MAVWFAEAPHHQCRQAGFITFAGVLCLAGADDVGVYRVFFMAGTADTPAANDVTPLDPSRQALGYCAFALLVLILAPVPHNLYGTFSIRCPYV